jgi:cyclase
MARLPAVSAVVSAPGHGTDAVETRRRHPAPYIRSVTVDQKLVPVTDDVVLCGDPAGVLGRSNAVAIIDGTSAVVIDSLIVPSLTDPLRRAVTARGAAVEVVVNTHPHVDHVGGNAAFAGARLLARPATVEMVTEMAKDTSFLPALFPEFAAELDGLRVCIPEPVDGDAGLPTHVRIVPLPMAHSPGDLAVWLPDERVLISGDVCFHEVVPLALPGHASLPGWIDALDVLIAFEPRFVVPGHGPLATAGALHLMREYLATLVDLARQVVLEGRAPESAVAAAAAVFDGWSEHGRHGLNLRVAVAGARRDLGLDPSGPDAPGRPGRPGMPATVAPGHRPPVVPSTGGRRKP